MSLHYFAKNLIFSANSCPLAVHDSFSLLRPSSSRRTQTSKRSCTVVGSAGAVTWSRSCQGHGNAPRGLSDVTRESVPQALMKRLLPPEVLTACHSQQRSRSVV